MLPRWLKEILPNSEVICCLEHVRSTALQTAKELQDWRRTGSDIQPHDIIRESQQWLKRWVASKADVLGSDRSIFIEWRRMPEQWGALERTMSVTREEAIRAWIQVSENADAEIARIGNSRVFWIAVGSAVVAIVVLGISFASLLLQAFS